MSAIIMTATVVTVMSVMSVMTMMVMKWFQISMMNQAMTSSVSLDIITTRGMAGVSHAMTVVNVFTISVYLVMPLI